MGSLVTYVLAFCLAIAVFYIFREQIGTGIVFMLEMMFAILT